MCLLKKNKKAMDLNVEAILYILSIIVVFLIIFVSNNSFVSAKSDLEKMAPNLTYQYPSLFIKSFLMLEVSEVDKVALNLDSKQTYYVQDLIYLGDVDSKKVVDDMRKKFISNMESSGSLNSFKQFAKINLVNNELLDINYDYNFKPLNEYEIVKQNYVFYFKGKDGSYRVVFFKKTLNQYNQKGY